MKRSSDAGSEGTPSGLHRNNDPNQRPSNRSLRFWAAFWTVFWGLLVGVGAAVGYVFLTDRHPIGILSILFFLLGCGLGVGLYLPAHFSSARTKRGMFVRVGGDPTGITPWMFGAMGGSITDDGEWEWYTPSGSSGESAV
ncbi:hypothetical protein [Arthrobacter sp. NPDC057259]|uniref:hypothetical protein n=1 Tax=Arthrobacter sp. NPDC057259 TaxID=3346073 RepID=UPI00362FA170